MAGGWVIAVLVELRGEPQAVRHFYALGFEDQGKAEWTAVDRALALGAVATSPVGGQEPVQAMARLTPQRMKSLGLADGEVRELGWKWPRRWL